MARRHFRIGQQLVQQITQLPRVSRGHRDPAHYHLMGTMLHFAKYNPRHGIIRIDGKAVCPNGMLHLQLR